MTLRALILSIAVTVASVVATAIPAASDSSTVATASSLSFDTASTCSHLTASISITNGTSINTENERLSTFAGTLANQDNAGGPTGPGTVIIPVSGPITTQLEGTVVAGQIAVGNAPINAPQDAVWFVLYQCHNAAPSTLLRKCFGPYTSCPHTALEAIVPRQLHLHTYGGTPTVDLTSAKGCYGTTGYMKLTGEGFAPVVNDNLGGGVSGSLSGSLTIPSTATPGTQATVTIGCGTAAAPIGDPTTVSFAIQASTPITPTPTAPAATPVVASPSFTG